MNKEEQSSSYLILMWLKDDLARQLESDILSEERAYLLSRAFDVIGKQLRELEK